jgi:histidyl-tRNA synthetase
MPIETPAMENLETLSGKYGEEGDKLLFKILNSGDFASGLDGVDLKSKTPGQLASLVSEKGLRYDLTVPLARYVVMNRNELVFPFKRYHIDKVWRADRPQKGRYREFYQCDADVIGSESLLTDAEFVFIFDQVLSQLNLPPFTIKLNNRKVLEGLSESLGFAEKFIDFTVSIDKLDKIGEAGVIQDLILKGFTESQIHTIQMILRMNGTTSENIEKMASYLQNSETGLKGIEELRYVVQLVESQSSLKKGKLAIDFTLARGLDYYTGSIYEVTIVNYAMGSIAGGGRYNNLTEAFGLSDMPGIGISFGLERIYDVLVAENLFPIEAQNNALLDFLIINFGDEFLPHQLAIASQLREQLFSVEIYPTQTKIAKQFQFAEKKGFKYCILLGEDEIKKNQVIIRNMQTKNQVTCDIADIANYLTS